MGNTRLNGLQRQQRNGEEAAPKPIVNNTYQIEHHMAGMDRQKLISLFFVLLMLGSGVAYAVTLI
ncbi:hypothetical protein [Haladaptatus sp. R4]|uniref:hypothetical protein n=1 Tax=Haladaptatus sp. R4 TaxID=1679489 RepID=UPI0012371E68|nr:hypothetical protein [Haladaptatus sp. R4]